MRIERISVRKGKKLNLGNFESTNLDLGMDVLLDEGEDPRETINGVHRILDQHLLSWERYQKEGIEDEDLLPSLINSEPKIQTAEEILEKKRKPKESKQKFDITETLICPKCNEQMTQKEGKEYFTCNKHWGYPDMIKKGEVREKTF